ncbi:MAG: hypothetical protein RR523_06370 [Cetobacterium sp.]|uniref:hypothetical protein n=1 Tax=Cetobacterium sp. TaxID=2071632 RepID=UPI002FCA3EF4
MEKFGTGIAVVGTILFIVYVWKVMGYVYFKKGNIKKDFKMLIVSLLVVAGGIAVGVYGARNQRAPLSKRAVEIIETMSLEETTTEQKAEVAANAYLKINDEDWAKYGDKVKEYYIAWQKVGRSRVDEKTIETEFENLRKKLN